MLVEKFASFVTKWLKHSHTKLAWASAEGAVVPWIFIHGTDIVDRDLKGY